MKNIVLCLFFLFSIFSSLYSLEYKDLEGAFSFSAGPLYQKISFKGEILSYVSKNYEYDNPILINIENSRFEIQSRNGIDYLIIEETGDKWLILYNKYFIMLYDSNGVPFFKGENVKEVFSAENVDTYNPPPFHSDSFLVETIRGKTVEYPMENLTKKAEIPFPWVEGEDDYGIGVKAQGEFGKNDNNEIYLFFSNGYVSYDRPDLYEKNSRVKRLAIKNLSTGDEIIFEIKDTSHFQLLDISEIVRTVADKIELTILDVYQGSLYKDTCVNMLAEYVKINVY